MSLPSLTRLPPPTEDECNQPPLCPNCDVEVVEEHWTHADADESYRYYFGFCDSCMTEVRVGCNDMPRNIDVIGYYYVEENNQDVWTYAITANEVLNECLIEFLLDHYDGRNDLHLEYLPLKEAKLKAEKMMILL